jgi:hypothetical protein
MPSNLQPWLFKMPAWQLACQLIRMTWTDCAGTLRRSLPFLLALARSPKIAKCLCLRIALRYPNCSHFFIDFITHCGFLAKWMSRMRTSWNGWHASNSLRRKNPITTSRNSLQKHPNLNLLVIFSSFPFTSTCHEASNTFGGVFCFSQTAPVPSVSKLELRLIHKVM